MTQIMRERSAVGRLIMVILCTILCSFSSYPGGDSFEIYVNNKLVLQEHLYGKKDVTSLPLNYDSDQDQLSIHYSHCGQIGTARNIIIKDEQNKVLKEWHFADSPAGVKNPMTCKVKDIVALGDSRNSLNLFYSSKELPKGQLLASIHVANKTARNK